LYISPFLYMYIFGDRALISIQMVFITIVTCKGVECGSIHDKALCTNQFTVYLLVYRFFFVQNENIFKQPYTFIKRITIIASEY
jgi:hypothetical protein